jgi:hypothetical protein
MKPGWPGLLAAPPGDSPAPDWARPGRVAAGGRPVSDGGTGASARTAESPITLTSPGVDHAQGPLGPVPGRELGIVRAVVDSWNPRPLNRSRRHRCSCWLVQREPNRG